MIGEVIDGKYKVTRLIGEGGMGAVFEGENILISRRVAIKVLHAAMALNKETVERFQREARAAGRIGNDHILEVLDLGKLPNGDYFMVLEFLDGEPLSNRIQRLGKLTPEQLAPIGLQVLAGLAAAHSAGIVHRDLKPDNIFVLKQKAGHKDFVKIIDFGISKFSPLSGEEGAKKMTQTGAIMGTPYYMSPEQARGSLEADARSDLYSIGVIMYEAVTGQVPFDGRTINELMFNIALSEPKPLRELVPDIDPNFEQLIARAMVKDREQRFQTADEFLTALSEWQTQRGAGGTIAMPVQGYTGSMPKVVEQNHVPAMSATGQIAARSTGQIAAGKTGQLPPGGASTTSTWATSQGAIQKAGAPTGLVVAGILGGLLVLGGGAFAAYRFSSGGEEAPVAQATSSSAPIEVRIEPAPTQTALATATPTATATAQPTVPPAPEPEKTAVTPAATSTAKASRTTSRPAARPASRTSSKTAPAASKTTTSEPKRKSALQFGY